MAKEREKTEELNFGIGFITLASPKDVVEL